MALAFTKYARQTKFTPLIRFDLKNPEDVEVRIDGYDVFGFSMSVEQYKQFRAAVGKFNPTEKPKQTPPPSDNDGDTWGA